MNSNFPSSILVIRPASFNDIPYIQEIVYETWPIAYGQILSNDQLQYMLDLFYRSSALQQQMHDNHHFYLALQDFKPIGFASFSQTENDVYKLQKLYVLPQVQKSGAGGQLLKTVEAAVKSKEGKSLLLNVNRNNTALSFYEKHGFKVIKEEDINIGHSYFMNDYVMEKKLL